MAAAPPAGETRYRERCLEKTGVAFRGDERLLDAGCGDGGVARLLRPRVREVVAVDVEASPAWLDEPGLAFRVADAERLPFDDESFDVVHSKDSLHHMDDPRAALAEYCRVLRPGGTLEAHYVPWGRRLLPLQHLVEEALERVPGLGPLLSYNYAVARREA